MSNDNLLARRWHDNRGDLSIAISLLEAIPQNITQYILDALIAKTDKEFNTAEVLKSFKSIGKERILQLHKAQNKRRDYDQDPNLYQIVNTFLILPEDAQEAVASDFIRFTSLIVDYMATCETFDLEPKEDDLQQMRAHFIREGVEASEAYVQSIHAEYHELLINEPTIKSTQIAQDQTGELKLRPSMLDS